MSLKSSPDFPEMLQLFFAQRLTHKLNASPRTVIAYRDSFRLLLAFAEKRLRKSPSALTFDDLSPSFVLEFLSDLEQVRHNSVRSRNARFAAIRSFMDYVALQAPSALGVTQAILAIPMKRFEKPLIGFLSSECMEAILRAPDSSTWAGRRDRVMLATMYNTGARVSEITGMRVADLFLAPSPMVRIHGKGRKERSVPLWRSTASQLKAWIGESRRLPDEPLFPNRSGGFLSRVGVSERLQLAARSAATKFPEIAKQRVSPHVIRQPTAMHLLQAGVNITVIAIWLGHESPTTTHQYVEADLKMKERALERLQPPKTGSIRYRPRDSLLQFLQTL